MDNTPAELFKLTTQDFKTRKGCDNELTWGAAVTHSVPGGGTRMCSEEVIHAYPSALLAVLCNPIHADLKNPVLWAASGTVVASDGLKVGVKSLTTHRALPLPKISTNQVVAFAILCSLECRVSSAYREWAEGWLSGKDRSEAAAARMARAAAGTYAAARTAWAARAAVAGAVASVAWAAAEAAEGARTAWAARTARAARAARAAEAAEAAEAAWAADAARSASIAVREAAKEAGPNFSALAEKAMSYA